MEKSRKIKLLAALVLGCLIVAADIFLEVTHGELDIAQTWGPLIGEVIFCIFLYGSLFFIIIELVSMGYTKLRKQLR